MQPNQNDTWQQPEAQPSQAPYAAPPEPTERVQPVVTMAPDLIEPDAPLAEDPAEAPITPSQQTVNAQADPVRWQAAEYIQREKNSLWLVGFIAVTLGLMALAIFLIQSWTFAVLVPVMAVALLTYTHRPPRMIDYTLSGKGLYINDRLYSFAEFKAFGVIRDDSEYSIMLVPVKRFRPGVSVYFPQQVGEALVDLLGTRLPMRDLRLDFVDRLIRKLRI